MIRQKQSKTILMDENSVKLLEVKNSAKYVKIRLGHVVQIHVCRLP